MNIHILIVEDEAALVERLRYNLEQEGYRVSVAMDGEEGLTAINEPKPDLIILDWMLPFVSGIELCRQVRRKPIMRSLPINMLTARGEGSDRVRGLELGADDYSGENSRDQHPGRISPPVMAPMAGRSLPSRCGMLFSSRNRRSSPNWRW